MVDEITMSVGDDDFTWPMEEGFRAANLREVSIYYDSNEESFIEEADESECQVPRY
jgi:hypothetical protein